MGKLVHHSDCPECGSSDARAVYQDTSSYCWSCKTYFPREEEEKPLEEPQYEKIPSSEIPKKVHGADRRVTPLATKFSPLEDRGIDAKAAEKYQVKAVLNNELANVKHVYPYFNRDGVHVGNKCRTKFEKGFFVEGDLGKSALFGQQAFSPGGRSLTIVEGECDALAAYQMFDHKYPVVSVKSSSEAVKNVQDNYEYVTSFDEVVLAFDADKGKVSADGTVHHPGQDAARAVAAILPLGKTRIVTFREAKDANEYLQAGKFSEFKKEWWSAPAWTPQGIRLGTDLWNDIKEQKNYETVEYPWEGLNELTYGIRLSEFVVVTADTGVGKTSVLKEIEHFILKHTDRAIGLLHLEEPNSDTGLGLMSVEANKPLHLPDIRQDVTEEELRVYYDKTVNSERVIIYDHFGSNDIGDLLNKIRHMAALGAKYIILDHLSIVVSDQSGDERKQLDEISTKLKTLCMELNIAVIAVVHQNRNGQIRGTAGVEQLANIVIKLFREKESEDAFRRNVTKVLIQKNRFCGRTGPACWLQYVPETGRLVELSKEQILLYEQGDNAKGVNPQVGEW